MQSIAIDVPLERRDTPEFPRGNRVFVHRNYDVNNRVFGNDIGYNNFTPDNSSVLREKEINPLTPSLDTRVIGSAPRVQPRTHPFGVNQDEKRREPNLAREVLTRQAFANIQNASLNEGEYKKNDESVFPSRIIAGNYINHTSSVNNTPVLPSKRLSDKDASSSKQRIEKLLRQSSVRDISASSGSAQDFLKSVSYKRPYELETGGNPQLWTDEVINYLIFFGNLCLSSADRCKKESIRHRRFSNTFQILVILLGALITATSLGDIDNQFRMIIGTVCGASTAILTSIQGFLKFPRKSELEALAYLELGRMARNIRIQLSKSKDLRVDPYEYIIKLENQREKILRKVGIDEEDVENFKI